MSEKELAREIKRLEKAMQEHARNLEFEAGRRGARRIVPPEASWPSAPTCTMLLDLRHDSKFLLFARWKDSRMLINCVAYQNGNKLKDIPVADISDYVVRPDCFVWVALLDASHEELDEMQEEFGLHPLAVEDAHHGHQRPKIEEYGDSVFAVLHLVDASAGELELGEVAIFVGRNYVLSVRSGSQHGFLGVRERCQREPELLSHGSGFVFYALMDAVVDRYFPVIDGFESELEAIEDRIFSKGSAAAISNNCTN